MKIVLFSGGTGGAKLVKGFSACLCAARPHRQGRLSPSQFSVVVNTGDDDVFYGLHVSPDLDTVMYTLAGCLDEQKGWGIQDDTFHFLREMEQLGGETWFQIGDKDLATHLYRTRRLREGAALSQITKELCERFHVDENIFPMSDNTVKTKMVSGEGMFSFQEFFVKHRCRVEIKDVQYAGCGEALAVPEVVSSIMDAGAVIFCPSNPVTSMGPILSVGEILDALLLTKASVLAVSPVVGKQAVSGPAGELLKASGYASSSSGVLSYYQAQAERKGKDGLVDIFVIDEKDKALEAEIEALGAKAVCLNTLMITDEDKERLAKECLTAIGLEDFNVK